MPAVEGGKEEREDEGSAPGTEIDISSSKHTCSPVPIRGKHAHAHIDIQMAAHTKRQAVRPAAGAEASSELAAALGR